MTLGPIIERVLDAAIHEAPDLFHAIKAWVHKEEARRVEQVRPGTGYAEQAASELRGEKPTGA